MTSSTAVLTATATETATPKHCAAAPLGSQCVGTDRLEALIERSGVLDTKTLNQLRNLVNEGKFKEADLAVFAKLAANVQAGRGSAAAGMDRDQLKDYLSRLVMNAADPNEINQGLHASCTAVAMMRDTARNDTPSFIHMALQLVERGYMENKKGEKAYINTTALKSALDDPKRQFDKCDIFERIFAATLIGHGVGPDAIYDHQTGSSTGMMGGANIEGLVGCTQSQYARIATFLKGEQQTVVEGDAAKATLIAQKPGQQLPLLCDIRWGPQGTKDACHMVLVTKIVGGRVYFENPHGSSTLDENRPPGVKYEGSKGHQSMPASEFFARLNRVVVPVGSGTPPAVAITAENDPVLQGIIDGTHGPTVHYDPAVGLLFNKNSMQQLSDKELKAFEEEFPEKKPLIAAEMERRKKVEWLQTEKDQDPRTPRQRMGQFPPPPPRP